VKLKHMYIAMLLSMTIIATGCNNLIELIDNSTRPRSEIVAVGYSMEQMGINNIYKMAGNNDIIMLIQFDVDDDVTNREKRCFEIFDHNLEFVKNIDYELYLEGNKLGFLQVYLTSDGGFWLTERSYDGHGDPEYLRYFDGNGAEVFTINMLESFGDNFRLIGIDNEGNAYLTNPYKSRAQTEPTILYVINKEAEMSVAVDYEFSFVLRVASLVDGTVLILNDAKIYRLYNGELELLFDFGETSFNEILAGSENTIYLTENQRIHMLDLVTGEKIVIADCTDEAPSYNYSDLVYTPDGELYALLQSRVVKLSLNEGNGGDDEANRTVITVATYATEPAFAQWASDYNQSNGEYKLEIVDYSKYDNANNIYGAIFRLNLDIITGNTPDIFIWGQTANMTGFNPSVYMSKGVFADIYEYLDGDADLARESFLPNLLEAVETSEGALYELPIEFIARVLACGRDEIGLDSWTLEEFFQEHEKRSDADIAFGAGAESLLYMFLVNNSDEYIDWAAGSCNFETEGFVELLKFCKTQVLEENADYGLSVDLIADGRQYLYRNTIAKVSDIQKFKANFLGEVTFIGYPTSYGRGNSFLIQRSTSISEYSEHKDVCWELLRGFYEESYQKSQTSYFPSNLSALEDKLENSADYYESGSGVRYSTGNDYFEVIYTDATLEETIQVRDLVYSLDRVSRHNNYLLEIIMDIAALYFCDERSAEETARLISNRVSIFLSEQS